MVLDVCPYSINLVLHGRTFLVSFAGWYVSRQQIYFKTRTAYGYSGKISDDLEARNLKLLRGAPLSDDERRDLNLRAGRIIESLGITIDVTIVDFDYIREIGYAGYAEYYLQECYDESILTNKAEIKIYNQLLDIDSQLGTPQAEQLFECVLCSVRMVLIKV